MHHHRLTVAALALAAAPAWAQAAAEPPVAAALDPAAERSAIDFAIARGRLLYAVDRAGWVATDDLQAKMPDWRSAGMRGYVVERDGEGFHVLFYGGAEDMPVAFYRGRVQSHRIVSSEVFPAAARPPLSPLQRRLAAAREAAGRSASSHRPCANAPFNVAAIPPETADGPIDVYLLTPQTRNGEYPFGGHYRMTIASDGSVGSERAFTNSCLTMRGDPRAGGREAAMVVTHLLDPVPTEIHVFTSLTARLPVIVLIPASERIYGIAGDEIVAIPLPEQRQRRRRR